MGAFKITVNPIKGIKNQICIQLRIEKENYSYYNVQVHGQKN